MRRNVKKGCDIYKIKKAPLRLGEGGWGVGSGDSNGQETVGRLAESRHETLHLYGSCAHHLTQGNGRLRRACREVKHEGMAWRERDDMLSCPLRKRIWRCLPFPWVGKSGVCVEPCRCKAVSAAGCAAVWGSDWATDAARHYKHKSPPPVRGGGLGGRVWGHQRLGNGSTVSRVTARNLAPVRLLRTPPHPRERKAAPRLQRG